MPLSTWESSLEQTEESPLKASKLDSSKMVRHIWYSLTIGMDMSAIREIKYLQELQHENITEAYLTTMKRS
jgi:hypothetical protein